MTIMFYLILRKMMMKHFSCLMHMEETLIHHGKKIEQNIIEEAVSKSLEYLQKLLQKC